MLTFMCVCVDVKESEREKEGNLLQIFDLCSNFSGLTLSRTG